MTAAKLVPSPGEASGLTHTLNDRIYADLVAGRTPNAIAVVGLLVPVEHGEKRTAKGTHRHVRYDFLRLEPVRDAHDADQIAWQVTRCYEQRTTPATGQAELPLTNSPEEKRVSLIEAIQDWAAENALTPAEVDEKLVDYFGGPEYAPSTVAKASLLHLLEFAGAMGAVDDSPVAPQLQFTAPDAPADDSDPDDDADDTDGEQPAAATLTAVPPFQQPDDDA